MESIEHITGTIDHFIYQDTEGGFSVCVLLTDDTTKITLTGQLAHLMPGQQIKVAGQWTLHPKFGNQFTASAYQLITPSTLQGLVRYLGSGLIKGIGPTYAQKLVDCFGLRTLEIIENEPQRLAQVPGIGPKRLETICQAWIDQKEISQVMLFLQDKEISPAYAVKIYKTYGARAIEIVQSNPYRLARDIWGIGFLMADAIAKKMGFELYSVERISAGLTHAIGQSTEQGHLYVPLEELKSNTATLLQLTEPHTEQLLRTALRHLHEEQQIVVITYQEEHFISLYRHYIAEYTVASKINTLLSHHSPFQFNINELHHQLRTGKYTSSVELNEDQHHAVLTALENKVTIITGGPGTGKTTIIKTLIKILQVHKISYLLAAPTGRAAKRMSESTGVSAHTIHRLLEFDVRTRQFTKNERVSLNAQFIIIDESSMIDIFLAQALLKAIPFTAHVVFIGDTDQLPSVGAGNFLFDLITSKKVPCIRLAIIFRQAQSSLIITNAHRINQGEFPTLSNESHKKDFLFIKEEDPTQLAAHLHHIYTTYLPRLNLSPHDSMILTPMNRGGAGTQALNNCMQRFLNPHSNLSSITKGGVTFAVKDRVMQIRNNYDKGVFNGDLGTIKEINASEGTLHIQFAHQLVEYDQSELDELTLAYAITIHKSQGSEFPFIIVPLFVQHYTLLQRNLLYTAITRAQKFCIFIGQSKAIGIAINNNKSTTRLTFLSHFLTTPLVGR